jgi:putative flippase GtrA
MKRVRPSGALIGQLGSFGAVGLANTLVDIAVFWLLTALAGLPPLLANVASFSCGALCSFTLNRTWTFRATGPVDRPVLRAARFVVTTLVALGASTLFLALLLRVMGPMPAKLLSVGMSFGVGFLLQRYWVFAPAPRAAAPPAEDA